MEQALVLAVADLSGAAISAVPSAVTAEAVKLSLEPVFGKDPLLVADGDNVHPPRAVALGLAHGALNQPAGVRVGGELHVQSVNSRRERLKTFLRRHRGIATKRLDNYLNWLYLVGLQHNASSTFGRPGWSP
jgi:hypothetical protein